MPNHCHNRVTFYAHHSDGDESCNQIAKLKKIFTDENKLLYNLLQTVQEDSNYSIISSDESFKKLQARYNKN